MSDDDSDLNAHDVSGVVTKVKKYFDEGSAGIAPVNQVLTFTTRAYLADLDPEKPPHPTVLEQQLLGLVNAIIDSENQKAPRPTMKLPMSKTLNAWQVAHVMLRVHHIVKVAPSEEGATDSEYDPLTIYQTTGRGRGTYTANEETIRAVARSYNAGLSLNDFKEIVAILREQAPRTTQSVHRDLLAVDNGVFHYGTEPLEITIGGKEFRFEPKSLRDFDPAMVFLAKSHVRYVDNPDPVVITHPVDGTEWEVRDWVAELSDDEGVPDLIWEIIGAMIRPHVRWNKSAWFYAVQGNNGKGTLCSLMRNLVGAGSHTSIPLVDFGKDFALEPLLTTLAIIVDENDVGEYIDQAANIKAVVTGDVIQVNRKHRMPIAYQFRGFMVQCLNGFPRMKDKSESNYRRQLFVPFEKSFTGAERRYIKDDYLQRPEVLEYVLWYVLNVAGTSEHKGTTADGPGNYYTLSEPPATQRVLTEYKEANDPVRAFWEEFRGLFSWDLLPFTFLYDLYKAWYPTVSPSGSPLSRHQFFTDLDAIVEGDPDWYGPGRDTAGKNKEIRPGSRMNVPETLIAEFDLKNWKNPTYRGSDPEKISQPIIKDKYRGLLRRVPRSGSANQTDTDQDAA